MGINFDEVNAEILPQASNLLARWFPEGRFQGSEFLVGSLAGEAGDSLSVNHRTGRWSDFSTGEKGGDLISLYAALRGIKHGEAARALIGEEPPRSRRKPASRPTPAPPAAPPVAPPEPEPVPEAAPEPDLVHINWGTPSRFWTYRAPDGSPIGYVARYDQADGKKQIVPWRFKDGKWRALSLDKPRPLYNLHELAARPDDAVLICEGEKAADAAKKIVGKYYVTTTWSGGTGAVDKVDWSPLKDRKVLIWPDADDKRDKKTQQLLPYDKQPGVKAAHAAAEQIESGELKILNVTGHAGGWDADDAMTEGWDEKAWIEWAKPRAIVYQKPIEKDQEQQGPTMSEARIWDELGLELNLRELPFTNLSNATRIIEIHPELKGRIWFDEFHGSIYTSWGSEEVTEWSDVDDSKLCLFIQRECRIQNMGTAIISEAVTAVAHANARNEVRDWMDKLVWDKKCRLGDLMLKGFGSPGTVFAQAVGRCWMTSIAARVYKPGCKVDTMPILEGKQGGGKSSALGVLGGKWFSECHESITSKDFYSTLRGNLILEISELHAFRQSEVERIKGVISCGDDRYREPYARRATSHPRRCVFVGTTNRTDWNRDDTGARRFWPILTGEISHKWIADNREQLFAEAVYRYKDGAPWWDVPAEEAEDQQAMRRPEDPWEERVYEFLGMHQQIMTTDILKDGLSIQVQMQEKKDEMRVARILTGFGWTKHVTKGYDRKSIRVWRAPEDWYK